MWVSVHMYLHTCNAGPHTCWGDVQSGQSALVPQRSSPPRGDKDVRGAWWLCYYAAIKMDEAWCGVLTQNHGLTDHSMSQEPQGTKTVGFHFGYKRKTAQLYI
jgi:hypothetical protein